MTLQFHRQPRADWHQCLVHTRGMLDPVRICGWIGGHVSKFARGLSSGLVRVMAFLLPVVTFLAAGQAPSAPGFGARERIARAADRVLMAGLQAKIPPHVSEMLGTFCGRTEWLGS